MELGWTSIPQGLPGNITRLNLRGNLVSKIEDSSVFPRNLTHLVIVMNKLSYIKPNILPDSLIYIDLSDNLLTSLEDNTLPKSLKEIHLRNNYIHDIRPGAFPNAVFKIDLTNNQIRRMDWEVFPRTVEHLLALDYNNIFSISNGSGINVFRLVLRWNKLESTGGLALAGQFQHINLDSNRLTEIPYINGSSITLSLVNNTIRTISSKAALQNADIKHLSLSNNSISSIVPGVFPETLDSLRLENNLIEEVVPGLLPKNCRNVMLNGNPIHHISPGSFPMSIQSISLYDTKLTNITPGTFNEGLLKLDLENNLLTNITNCTLPSTLQTLSLTGNRIASIDRDAIPKKIFEIFLEKNRLRVIKSGLFTRASKCMKISASYNLIEEIEPASLPRGIRVLQIPHNKLGKIRPGAMDQTLIQVLELKYNLLTEINLNNLPPSLGFL
ncbi:leucine-rich repeat-containing protein 15-like [Nematostella vectensis]|uniref:leucine-rich repeat-containing protein 15-like n=1 Tax=Nematostella vectensis TaxID=45351 RepID=UPI002076F61F|nr:leucine-rich repeat-containing protein 15-like [Nematostella vectensis]